jgi:glyoxylase I family protein
VAKLHHSAIVTHDVETSLMFWRDGLGLEVLMDDTFEGPWPELFGGTATKLRSVFLGETGAPDSGIVELVDLGETAPPRQGSSDGTAGFFLLSLFADLDQVLPRLAGHGVGGEPKVSAVGPVRLAVVRDPNGVVVELMDSAARANLSTMTRGNE